MVFNVVESSSVDIHCVSQGGDHLNRGGGGGGLANFVATDFQGQNIYFQKVSGPPLRIKWSSPNALVQVTQARKCFCFKEGTMLQGQKMKMCLLDYGFVIYFDSFFAIFCMETEKFLSFFLTVIYICKELSISISINHDSSFSLFTCLRAAVVKWLSCWLAVFDSRSRRFDFRDWLSPTSKSQYGWNIAKAT